MTKDHLRLLGNMGFLHLVRCFFLYVIGLFWSTGVVLRIIQLLVTKPRKFLAYKNRNTRPKCLDNPNFGSHNFTRSKVRGTEGKRRDGAGGRGEGVCAYLVERRAIKKDWDCIGRSKGAPSIQSFSFSCSFWGEFGQIIG